jgi:hypothetical protein
MFDPQLFPRFERIKRSSTVYSFARPELAAAS